MNDNRITGAPVTEGGRLVGVLSRSDLLRAIASGPCDGSTDGADASAQLLDLEQSEVSQLMTADALTITGDATVLKAAQLMSNGRSVVNRLMVVDDQGLLVPCH